MEKKKKKESFRHWITGSTGIINQERGEVNGPSLWPGGSYQTALPGAEGETEPGGLAELRLRPVFLEAEMAVICRQNTSKDKAGHRQNSGDLQWGTLKSLSEYRPVHM